MELKVGIWLHCWWKRLRIHLVWSIHLFICVILLKLLWLQAIPISGGASAPSFATGLPATDIYYLQSTL